MEQEQFVTLENLASGAVGERFSEEFQVLIENIQDENTDPKAKRKLIIELTLEPNEGRNWADYTLKVSSKLAAHTPTYGCFSVGRMGGRVEATEIVAEQPSLLSQTLPENTPVGVQH